MTESARQAAEVAETYDSIRADQLYARLCGDADIRIGMYESTAESSAEASRRTVAVMASWLPQLTSESTVIDLAGGYGGAARYLVETYGCRVTCIGSSAVQNGRNRRLNQRANLSERIEVIPGSCEHLHVPTGTYDFAWSQDGLLHSCDRGRALKEVRRVLKPSGRFIFTNPMQADDCPPGAHDLVSARLRLHSLSSPGYYRSLLAELGFREERSADLTDQLVAHYSRVREELDQPPHELAREAAKLKQACGDWIEAGRKGRVRWGMYCFARAGSHA